MAAKKILLVEGVDDEHVLKNLCGARKVGKLDEFKKFEGVDRLLRELPVEIKGSNMDAMGVVIDADVNLADRWDSLRNRLMQAGYKNIPEQPDPKGTIISAPPGSLLPRFGVWIMPDNQSAGILEDFLRFLVPDKNQLFEHVETSIASIPAGEQRFSDAAKPKAVIHTWLAWQKEPGKPMGTAITARFLDPDAPQVDTLIQWLQRLYFSNS